MQALPTIRIEGLDTDRARVVAAAEFADVAVWLLDHEGQGWVVMKGEGDVMAIPLTDRRAAGWLCLLTWPQKQVLWESLIGTP